MRKMDRTKKALLVGFKGIINSEPSKEHLFSLDMGYPLIGTTL
ncbi:MAG: hypothetical protein AAGH81_02595 [Bacteroidota bacterium]